MSNLTDDIKSIINSSLTTDAVVSRYLERLSKGNLTRDEDPTSHYCAYFLPYNEKTKNVLIIHHKKSGLWLSPGGHIDKDERLLEALKREVFEELGVKDIVGETFKPFLLTITPINKTPHLCKEHFDIWFRIPTSEEDLNIDFQEFHDAKWLTPEEAGKIVTDGPNLEALEKMKQLFANS